MSTGTDSLDDEVRVAVYRHFIEEGVAPTEYEVAQVVGAGLDAVRSGLRRLADQHVLTFLPNTTYLWMANPFSAIPTAFAVRAGDKRWWGNCIWDALGILATVELDGTVSTWCPDCGEHLEVHVRDGEISGDAGTVHFSVPAAKWWDDIGFT